MDSTETKEKMAERMRRTKQSFEEMRAETQAKARRAVRITNDYAHDHPWRVVAAAAGMALVVGLLMRKSPRKILVRREGDAPVLKVREVKQRNSPWEAITAFMPIALFAAKAAIAARNKNAEPHVDTAALP
ncbi:MAG TPA: hypothetical protein VM680_16150 [Verrucomicrobiae bacterium]|nr:hypothetical protein [Verrucomicrobiae bacterium]